MTNWTQTQDDKSEYRGLGGYVLATQSGVIITTQDGRDIAREGITTEFSGVADSSERYVPFGVGLKIAAEDFTWILTEDKNVRVVHSKQDYIEEGDSFTNYAKVKDSSTKYISEEDSLTNYIEEEDA